MRIESLAVLPFDNMTGDPAQEYFADGMTEALIAELLERKSFLLFFLRDPKLDPLRRDRRFKETLERLRLPE